MAFNKVFDYFSEIKEREKKMRKGAFVRRICGGMAFALAAAISAAVLFAPSAALAEGRQFDGNASLYIGTTVLNGPWNFSTPGSLTGKKMDLNLTQNYQVGIQFDINRKDVTGDKWGVNPFAALYALSASASDDEAAQVSANTRAFNKYKADLTMLELDLGVKKYFDDDGGDLIPVLGVGLAVINTSYTFKNTGTTYTDDGSGKYIPTASVVTKDDDDANFFGGWISGGLVFRPVRFLDLGAEVRYLYTREAMKEKVRINAWNLGFSVGYRF